MKPARLIKRLLTGGSQIVETASLIQALGGLDSANIQAVAGALGASERSQKESAARDQVLDALVSIARDASAPPQVRLDAAEAVLEAT